MRVKNQTNAGFSVLSAMKQIGYFYALGKRKEVVFNELKGLLVPFGITRFYTDDWGAYERNLDSSEHEVGKKTRKRLSEKT